MMKDHVKGNAKNTAKPQKPAQAAIERPSLPGERAEGEGMIAQKPAEAPTGVEGEGSYTASRRYDEGVERSVEKGDTEQLAKAAAKALDGPEGAELRRAEQAAKRGQTGPK